MVKNMPQNLDTKGLPRGVLEPAIQHLKDYSEEFADDDYSTRSVERVLEALDSLRDSIIYFAGSPGKKLTGNAGLLEKIYETKRGLDPDFGELSQNLEGVMENIAYILDMSDRMMRNLDTAGKLRLNQ